ncbi:MAG: hypothetical protein K2G03_00335, partial [Bacilli bacterium]|nr:hypothetical protein [Bacilli bacterium]
MKTMSNNEFKEFADLKAIENLSPNALNRWKYYHNIVDYEKGEGTVLVFSSDKKRWQIATEFKRDLSLINIQFS